MKCPNCNEADHEPTAKYCHICGMPIAVIYGEQPKLVDKPKDGLQTLQTFSVNGVPFKMILVQGGTFWMGAQNDNNNKPNYTKDSVRFEGPVHKVTIDSFYICETIVTQALWCAIMGTNVKQEAMKRCKGMLFLFGEGEQYPMCFFSCGFKSVG